MTDKEAQQERRKIWLAMQKKWNADPICKKMGQMSGKGNN